MKRIPINVTIQEPKYETKEELLLSFRGRPVTEMTFIEITRALLGFYHNQYVNREIPVMPGKIDVETEVRVTFPDFRRLE